MKEASNKTLMHLDTAFAYYSGSAMEDEVGSMKGVFPDSLGRARGIEFGTCNKVSVKSLTLTQTSQRRVGSSQD